MTIMSQDLLAVCMTSFGGIQLNSKIQVHGKAEHTQSHFCETHCYGNVNRDLHISSIERKRKKRKRKK